MFSPVRLLVALILVAMIPELSFADLAEVPALVVARVVLAETSSGSVPAFDRPVASPAQAVR